MPILLAPASSVHTCRCGRRIIRPAAGVRTCDTCRAAREAARSLERILASGDARTIAEAAGWLQMLESDGRIFRSAAVRRVFDRAVGEACRVAESVREVRDPILPGDGDDFASRVERLLPDPSDS